MLEKLQDMPSGVDGIKAVGTISREDYQHEVEPLVDAARRENRRIRLLYEIGPDFQGFTLGAAWEDTKFGFGAIRQLDGSAVVTDIRWIREMSRLSAFLMPFPIRIFGNAERAQAIEWLGSLPEGPGVSHHLVAESGVIVVDVREPLRVQDFDALAQTADAWLGTHDDLRGLVIHARAFPGWENITSLLRHLRFVRDHHRKVKRVAVAADSKLADLMPHLAKHFVQAELTSFGYDELDDAVAWAGSPAIPRKG